MQWTTRPTGNNRSPSGDARNHSGGHGISPWSAAEAFDSNQIVSGVSIRIPRDIGVRRTRVVCLQRNFAISMSTEPFLDK
jgi:hypothetical protein